MGLEQAIKTLANMLGESDKEDEAIDIAIAVMEVVRRWEHEDKRDKQVSNQALRTKAKRISIRKNIGTRNVLQQSKRIDNR